MSRVPDPSLVLSIPPQPTHDFVALAAGDGRDGADVISLTDAPMVSVAIERDEAETVWVPVGDLRGADSPRLQGELEEHVLALADADHVPAIVVHRPSMRIIDGMHRWRAALLRGASAIEVRFFDGDEDAAFVLGVESNIAHGNATYPG